MRIAGAGLAAAAAESRVADHLLLDFVDLGLHAILARGVVLGQPDVGIVHPRRAAQRSQLLGRQTFAAHPAQHVEFAFANEIVAPLALDHRLEFALLELEFARVVLARLEVGPVGGGVRNEPHHLAEKALVLGHRGGILLRDHPAASLGRSTGRRCRRRGQSPNIFCLSSRRCWASSESVAVGRAISRARPIGSPVSSQKP